MKPLKITMEAFGPYKNREVIDFTDLDQHRLFVISGNTGAGKTTIFDAICFALYGEASGEERKDAQLLRSHFADDHTHTSVELEFQLHQQTYRVFRQIPHVKSGNKTATGGKYEFYKRTGDQEIPCVDRFHVTDINQRIEQILGLSKDQFSQIVMLPQGEFRKLLTSETENKEEILRRIFKTGLYKRFAERLKERKQSVRKFYEDEARERELYIGQIKGVLPERADAPLFQVLSQEHYNTNQIIEALKTELAHYGNEIEQYQKKREEAEKAYQDKLTVYHRAESVNERFNLLDQKRGKKAQMDAELPQMKDKEQKLEQAEKASHLEVHEQHMRETMRDEAAKQKTFEAAKNAEKAAVENLSQAKDAYQKEEAKHDERENIKLEINGLQDFLPIVRELDKKKAGLLKLAANLDKEVKALASLKETVDKNKEQKTSLQRKINELEQGLKAYPQKLERLGELREQCGFLKQYLDLQTAIRSIEKTVDVKYRDFQIVQNRYDQLQNRWLEGQAALLAGHLHNGEACPVCGSTEHPNKAAASEDLPSKEELDRLGKEKTSKQEAYLKVKSDLEAYQKQSKEMNIHKYGFQENDLSGQYERLVEQGKQLRRETDELKKNQESVDKLKAEYEALEKTIQDESVKWESGKETVQTKREQYNTAKALYDQEIEQIPKDLQSLKQLEKQIEETKQAKERLERQWKEVQEQWQKAKEGAATAKANTENALSQQTEAAEKAKKAAQQFSDALQKAGFAEKKTYQDAKMPETERAALKQAIEAFHTERSNLTSQIEELEKELKNQTRIDLAALSEEVEQLKRALESAGNALQESERYKAEAENLIGKISKAAEKVQAAEQNLQTVTDLYDVVRGDNARKISFERYLQIEFLEQIVQAANERLKRLSNGQFYLMRSDRLEKRGRQSGLGLDVYDAYTGQTRDVKSLSGGEKFNASLCLALGMADVIQAFEGGISIETMFIDEGFGSLDEESLNKAIDTLIDLQKAGRMVGVISHVQELKNAIPAVLSVEKTKEGHSRTQFVVE
ncbi:MAG TPA: SMC family ATPase [Bacillales bacterium]|nr:SMC family ATPase [Bacillales bacterium]